MADLFISYAHEDQAFVRRLVPALEAEGFSVWWDHTIPPGKSWDTFIAKGIAEARCCIVVWSPRSIESDWVKEEATLGKDAGKLVPAAIDGAEPPIGFRRIQAANLTGWSGDKNNAQWQLLIHAAREVVRASPAVGATASPPTYRTTASQARKPQRLVIGLAALGVVVALGLGALVLTQMTASTQPNAAEIQLPTATTDSARPEIQAEATPDAGNADVKQPRRERDQAVEEAPSLQAENERLQRESAPPTRVPAAVTSLGCFYWFGTMANGASGAYFFEPDGDVQNNMTRWSQSGGNAAFQDNRGYTHRGVVSGDTFTGAAFVTSSGANAGTFTLQRGARGLHPGC